MITHEKASTSLRTRRALAMLITQTIKRIAHPIIVMTWTLRSWLKGKGQWPVESSHKTWWALVAVSKDNCSALFVLGMFMSVSFEYKWLKVMYFLTQFERNKVFFYIFCDYIRNGFLSMVRISSQKTTEELLWSNDLLILFIISNTMLLWKNWYLINVFNFHEMFCFNDFSSYCGLSYFSHSDIWVRVSQLLNFFPSQNKEKKIKNHI